LTNQAVTRLTGPTFAPSAARHQHARCATAVRLHATQGHYVRYAPFSWAIALVQIYECADKSRRVPRGLALGMPDIDRIRLLCVRKVRLAFLVRQTYGRTLVRSPLTLRPPLAIGRYGRVSCLSGSKAPTLFSKALGMWAGCEDLLSMLEDHGGLKNNRTALNIHSVDDFPVESLGVNGKVLPSPERRERVAVASR